MAERRRFDIEGRKAWRETVVVFFRLIVCLCTLFPGFIERDELSNVVKAFNPQTDIEDGVCAWHGIHLFVVSHN